MEPKPPEASVATGTDLSSGALVRMLYVERQMKGYAVTSSELRQIGSLNRIATVFFSVASGCAGYALGVIWDVATTPADPIVQTVGGLLVKILFGAAVVCGGLGVFIVFVFLALVALTAAWVIKYAPQKAGAPALTAPAR